MNRFYVYQFLRSHDSPNGPAGSPYYIGKGRGKRAWWGSDRTTPRPTDPSCISIIQDNLCENDALQLEMLLIFLHGRVDNGTGILHNRTDGGEGTTGIVPSPETRAIWSRQRMGNKRLLGFKFSEESKKLMSQKRLGIPLSPETRVNISKGLTGLPKSEQHKNNMSKARTGVPINNKHNKGRLGQSHLKETKKKMAEKRRQWWLNKKSRTTTEVISLP